MLFLWSHYTGCTGLVQSPSPVSCLSTRQKTVGELVELKQLISKAATCRHLKNINLREKVLCDSGWTGDVTSEPCRKARAGLLRCRGSRGQRNDPSESSCIKHSLLCMTWWGRDSSSADSEGAAASAGPASWTGPFSPTPAVTLKQHPLASHSTAQTGQNTHTHTLSQINGPDTVHVTY